MSVTINGTSGVTTPALTSTGAITGDGISFADNAPANSLVVNSSGNVGIGTSSPAAKLNVSGSSSNAVAIFDKGASGQAYTQLKNSAQAFSTYVDINNNSTNWLATYDTTNAALVDVYVPGASAYRAFYTVGSERMRINSSGVVLIGKTIDTEAGAGLVFNPSYIRITTNGTGSATNIQFNNNGGTNVGAIVTSGSTTTYATSSDYRLKENIQPMQNALSVVAQLNPVTYTWKADGSDGQGFIAHELQAVVPDCVTGEKDAVDDEGNPIYQGIDTSFLVATLTKAIQELSAKNDALEARITALEAK